MLTKSRDLNSNPRDILENPGPGQYDLNFNEELKILDHKLSARYKKTPFGVSSPRFETKDLLNPKTERPKDISNNMIEEANGKFS